MLRSLRVFSIFTLHSAFSTQMARPPALTKWNRIRQETASAVGGGLRSFASKSAESLNGMIADNSGRSRHTICMNSDPLELKEKQTAYHARWEAVETVKAQELAAMTEERAWQIIQWLGAVEGWRDNPDWSGLVEQQEIFHKGRRP